MSLDTKLTDGIQSGIPLLRQCIFYSKAGSDIFHYRRIESRKAMGQPFFFGNVHFPLLTYILLISACKVPTTFP